MYIARKTGLHPLFAPSNPHMASRINNQRRPVNKNIAEGFGVIAAIQL
ncbi:hypothetical protein [Paenibacillus barcinonensis]|nr:hypothetical protein [Paenibacillus barcinonensis]